MLTDIAAHRRPAALPPSRPSAGDPTEGPLGGWHLLALATYDRPLTPAEVTAVERLSARDALDVLFPGLSDAARHEALCTLE